MGMVYNCAFPGNCNCSQQHSRSPRGSRGRAHDSVCEFHFYFGARREMQLCPAEPAACSAVCWDPSWLGVMALSAPCCGKVSESCDRKKRILLFIPCPLCGEPCIQTLTMPRQRKHILVFAGSKAPALLRLQQLFPPFFHFLCRIIILFLSGR